MNEFKFTDKDIECELNEDSIDIEVDPDRGIWGRIYKPDVIALAKRFGITAEDLG